MTTTRLQAWTFPSGDPETASCHEASGDAPSDLARFYTSIAEAEPHVVVAPRIGVRDACGEPIRAYDLLALDPFPGTWTVSPSLAVARVTEDGPDVVQLVVGRSSSPQRRFEVSEGDDWFHYDLHERDGPRVWWDRVRAVGSAFRRPDLLAAAGLSLADLLQGLTLPSPEADHQLRSATPDPDRLRHLLQTTRR